MKRVLITGAGGFLGRQAVQEYLAAGYAVRAGDLPGVDMSFLQALGAETVVCDLSDPETVETALTNCNVLLHAAGLFDHSATREKLFAVNSDGCRLMAETAADQGVERIVLISSVGVYGIAGQAIDEEGEKKPKTPYDQSKWSGEQEMTRICAEQNLPLVVLRPTLIYGPGSRYGLATWVALLTLRHHLGLKKLILRSGGPVGHHVHVEDVARAAVLVTSAEAAVGGVYNVTDDTPLPAGELIQLLGELVGVEIREGGLPWWTTKVVGLIKPLAGWLTVRENQRLAHLWGKFSNEKEISDALCPRIDVAWIDYLLDDHAFDNSKLKELGFTVRHPRIKEGLRETMEWYKQESWLPSERALPS